MSERTVYIRSHAGGTVSVFHTDEECPALAKAKTVNERDRETLLNVRPGLDECAKCAGTEGANRDYDPETERRFYDLATEADADDVFATDGGDEATVTGVTDDE